MTRRSAALLAVAALYVVAAAIKVRLYEFHPSALIGFGCHAPSSSCLATLNWESLPHSAVIFRSGGYDGQFYYSIGRELFGGPRAVVDSDPFRWARIGLPLMAGPLLALGELGRVLGIPITLLALHLGSVWTVLRARPGELGRGLILALNPFSLLSFLLCTADGAALSLAVLGALALESAGKRRVLGWSGLGWALVAFALLTKETLIVVPAALALASLFERDATARGRAGRMLALAATALPLLVWWKHVGFSLGLAASHGGLPLSGLIRYLPDVDLSRAVLVLVLVLSVATGVLLVQRPLARAAGVVLLGTAALVSTATAGEYWATIANIARLFTPMAAAPVLLGPLALKGSRWSKCLALAWASSLLLLTVVIVVREATRRPLPFFVLPG